MTSQTFGCRTSGGDLLQITGTNWTTPLVVYVKGQPCQQDPPLLDGVSTYTNLTCELPPGVGLNVPVQISSKLNGVSALSSLTTISYALPQITSVTSSTGGCTSAFGALAVESCSRDVTVQLVIHGSGFGASGVKVYVGNTLCAVQAGQDDGNIVCNLPPGGYQQNLAIMIIQQGTTQHKATHRH